MANNENQGPRKGQGVPGALSDKSRNPDLDRRPQNADAGQGDEGIDDEEKAARSQTKSANPAEPYVDTETEIDDDDVIEAESVDTRRNLNVDRSRGDQQ